MSIVHWLSPSDPPGSFPPVDTALAAPNGLLAAGGDLRVDRLLAAYARGVFPWYEERQPILWWSPDPRAVLFPDELRISRSLRRVLRQRQYTVTFDTAFEAVVDGCAAPRAYSEDTWITTALRHAFVELYRQGYAHSVEAWRNRELVGGLYGLSIGKVFFGESMFSRESNASKVALVRLVDRLKTRGFSVIDCQIPSAHLESLGSRSIPRRDFCRLLNRDCARQESIGRWHPHGDTEAAVGCGD